MIREYKTYTLILECDVLPPDGMHWWWVLVESVVLSILGGVLGAAAAFLLFDGYRASTINWQTFSQVTFAFRVTPVLLGKAVACATLIGIVGGLFPALRAARLPIASGLRES